MLKTALVLTLEEVYILTNKHMYMPLLDLRLFIERKGLRLSVSQVIPPKPL